MNYSLYITVVWIIVICAAVRDSSFTAISFGLHTHTYYLERRNEDPPLETDPVVLDSRIQERICEDITNSGFFDMFGFVEVNNQISDETDSPSRSSETSYNKYPYRKQHFRVDSFSYIEEHVFLCPVTNRLPLSKSIRIFYVSKEYNVGAFGQTYKPGRFVFKCFVAGYANTCSVILAEEPAISYAKPSFNVEFYYLQIRKFIQPAESNEIDPLCKLISKDIDDRNNQHYRLCVAVSRSSYFKDKTKYPRPSPRPCSEEKVSFRTAEVIQKVAGESYYERMTICSVKTLVESDDEESFFYISRGYRSNQLLVYFRDPEDDKIYLENLSTNISIVDELNSFDFIED